MKEGTHTRLITKLPLPPASTKAPPPAADSGFGACMRVGGHSIGRAGRVGAAIARAGAVQYMVAGHVGVGFEQVAECMRL